MIPYEEYFEYIKTAFAENPRIVVEIYAQLQNCIMVRIRPVYTNSNAEAGCLEIRFDRDGIAYFGDFFADDFMDDIDKVNTWEIRTKEEILQLLDKKFVEYKHYIDYGYFFAFYDKNNRLQRLWPCVYTGDINKIDYKAVYLDQRTRDEISYDQIKSVTVSNFYGDIIVDNKILN